MILFQRLSAQMGLFLTHDAEFQKKDGCGEIFPGYCWQKGIWKNARQMGVFAT